MREGEIWNVLLESQSRWLTAIVCGFGVGNFNIISKTALLCFYDTIRNQTHQLTFIHLSVHPSVNHLRRILLTPQIPQDLKVIISHTNYQLHTIRYHKKQLSKTSSQHTTNAKQTSLSRPSPNKFSHAKTSISSAYA